MTYINIIIHFVIFSEGDNVIPLLQKFLIELSKLESVLSVDKSDWFEYQSIINKSK